MTSKKLRHSASPKEADGFKMASNVYLIAAVLSIFSFMTVKEIIFPSNVQASNPDKMDRIQKAAVFTGPTLKFLYCYS
ncbi:hypothetical protein ACROYT_G029416 [Oculina patagonica]